MVYMIKEVESREARSHQTLMENSEVSNRHENKDGDPKIILSIWYFKCKRLPDEILIKHKSILCVNGGIKKWGVNSWGKMLQC